MAASGGEIMRQAVQEEGDLLYWIKRYEHALDSAPGADNLSQTDWERLRKKLGSLHELLVKFADKYGWQIGYTSRQVLEIQLGEYKGG